MQLELLRISSATDSTLGVLFDTSGPRRFLCFTLEDEYRTRKVLGETRIPAGTFTLRLRGDGGFHQRYAATFPDIHQGMLWLADVPGFEWVLIHTGNSDDDTAGCILVGDSAAQNLSESGRLGESRSAYRRVYPPIARALAGGHSVTLRVVDFDVPVEGFEAAPIALAARFATPVPPLPAMDAAAVLGPLEVARGQLTFDAEGSDAPGRYFSRVLHVPTASSGLTLGRGFDLRDRDPAAARADLIACGIAAEIATRIATGAGLRGEAARAVIAAQNLADFEITHAQQKALFENTYAQMLRDVERICAKRDVEERYGRTDFAALDARIRDVLVDLRYRGDYTGATRARVQTPVAGNDRAALHAVMADEPWWRGQCGVPADRFRRRRDYLA